MTFTTGGALSGAATAGAATPAIAASSGMEPRNPKLILSPRTVTVRPGGGPGRFDKAEKIAREGIQIGHRSSASELRAHLVRDTAVIAVLAKDREEGPVIDDSFSRPHGDGPGGA